MDRRRLRAVLEGWCARWGCEFGEEVKARVVGTGSASVCGLVVVGDLAVKCVLEVHVLSGLEVGELRRAVLSGVRKRKGTREEREVVKGAGDAELLGEVIVSRCELFAEALKAVRVEVERVEASEGLDVVVGGSPEGLVS